MVIKLLTENSTKPGRKIQPRSLSASNLSAERLDVSQHHRLPDAADLRRMCIITKSDLNRIYGNVDRRQREKEANEQELERKRFLAARSAEVTKHWSNTIAGAREKKLEMKKIREQQEEERRKAVDVEEEKFAAERRREQIEKAKQLQYFETDRVRTFHSALVLTEVLKERELQLEMKKKMDELRKTDEDDVKLKFQTAQEDYHRVEREKAEKRARDRANLSQYHLAQIDQRRVEQNAGKQKDHLEGEEYRRLAEQYALEQIEIDKYRRMMQKDTKQMYDDALEQKEQVKRMEQMLDEEEDEELRIYADAKKKIARMRREKELQAHREKQEARDHMIGYLGSLQKRAEADYDTQIFRAQAQREAKEAKEEQEKFDKRKAMQESIAKHRQETVKRRQAQKEIDDREEKEMQEKKFETDQLYHMYQQEKDKQRRQDAQTLSNLHLKQAQERKDRERTLKETEVEETLLDKHMNDVERQQFEDYAGRVIAYMEENGRNTYPMKKVYAEEIRRFDQFDQNYKRASSSSSSSANGKKSLDDTKKHLGFQWELPKK